MSTIDKTYSTVAKIRSAFLSGELTAVEAVDEFAKKQTQKAWHTKEWRLLREKLIKDKCEQCGTSEPPMVLQHMWHPEKLGTLIRDIKHKYEREYAVTHPLPFVAEPIPEDLREGCPGCGKFSGFNWRKTQNNWRCVHCHAVFEKLVEIPVLSAQQYEVYSSELKELNDAWNATFMMEMEEKILTEALNTGFEQNDRYISCADTVTFCKKCAFMWDKNKKKICEGCGKWAPIYTTPESCWTCLDKIYNSDWIEELYEQEASQKSK